MKSKLALGMMATGIFIMGVSTGISMAKCAMKKRGVIL